MAVWLITCCPPYEAVDVAAGEMKAIRPDSRHGQILVDEINPASDFTDNMWCRDRETIVAFEPIMKAHRE